MCCFIHSCIGKDAEPIIYTEYYLKNHTQYDLTLKENYWSICGVNDSIELVDIRKQHDKSFVYIDSTILIWCVPDDNKDTSLIISKCSIPLTSIKHIRDNVIRYEYYYYDITDSILQDIKDSMAVKGYLPQLHEEW